MLQRFIICLAFCFWAIIHSSYACTCIGESNIADAVKSVKVVFLGKVINAQVISTRDTSLDCYFREIALKKGKKFDSLASDLQSKRKILYKVEVLKVFKGNIHKIDTVIISTGMGNGDCGYQFELGKNFIIYGYKSHKTELTKDLASRKFALYATDICTRTQLENNDEILAITAALKKKFLKSKRQSF